MIEDNNIYKESEESRLAFDLIQNTGTCVFLTGKAGTGKTTFLKHLRQKVSKRMVVLAPTGVAAINAGGVTLHSFFQLPLEPYIPDSDYRQNNRYQHFSKEKLNIIKSVDLIVIDEISMVRADVLDAVDASLRRIRHSKLPFAGVQLLLIGDLQQLPPVVTEQENALLSQYYTSSFFFNSRALNQTNYVCVELQKVYRQSDEDFVRLLNNVRDNKVDDETLRQLNQRYIPNFNQSADDHFIRLTTHNSRAKAYNDQQLSELPTSEFHYEAEVDGDFPEYDYPTDAHLCLRVGAQVMFVKNDPSSEKLFYNGKIGRVTKLGEKHIEVRFPDGVAVNVQPQQWENTKYTINETSKEIEEKVQGTFTQYPLKLAWAITIHKSQGLTFEKVLLDASNAFAHGQVYVALSRCKSLQGLVLSSLLPKSAVLSEKEVTDYNANISNRQPSEQVVAQMRDSYYLQLLMEQFDFGNIRQYMLNLIRLFEEYLAHIYPKQTQALIETQHLAENEIYDVAGKFGQQIRSLNQSPKDKPMLQERTQKGAAYFLSRLEERFVPVLQLASVDVANKDVAKRLNTVLADLQLELKMKYATLKATSVSFSVADYLKAKSKSLIQNIDTNEKRRSSRSRENAFSKSAENQKTASMVTYPDFYKALCNWRMEVSKKKGITESSVLSQTLLLNIEERRPKTSQQLKAVPGFGRTKLEYMSDLISLANNGVFFTQKNEQVEKSFKVLSTIEKSYELYKQGKNISEIAKERSLSEGTVSEHLLRYVESGDIPLSDLVQAPKIQMIRAYMSQHPSSAKFRDIYEALNGVCSYSEIRFVMAAAGRNN